MAFAFSTNDEINDMTFYRYNVINFATTPLDSVYFGYWVDSDLGFCNDDWVGCDTTLSLGMTFNGDAVDGPDIASYGENPPIFGTDFFQGLSSIFMMVVPLWILSALVWLPSCIITTTFP